MKQIIAICPLFFALTACPASIGLPPPPTDNARPFTASGNEPGWTLTINADEMIYVGSYGETKITTATPAPIYEGKDRVYSNGSMSVRIAPGPCADSMVEREYASRVTVTVKGQTVSGCGGAIYPPRTLTGTNWQIIAIDGQEISDPRPENMIIFEAAAMSGFIGCNRFSADYTQKNGVLRFGPVAATRKYCPGILGQNEAILLTILDGAPSSQFDDEGNMTLRSGNHTALLARRY
ncbi:META domain-containing protein [Sphingorhabdus arenilitoris]|uniref:META domain-containing protein n=1 Tax=Sphingorhabdus arenilitoris TaxID=1490041 RepID=A0ABV8REU5_9SPHN